MFLLEFEGKSLFKSAGLEIPSGFLFDRKGDYDEPNYPAMVKAQMMGGKRGKAGLVRSVSSKEELDHMVGEINQAERRFDHILIEEQIDFSKELYLSFTFDTNLRSPVLVASKFGGMDIEEVAKRTPQAILKLDIDLTIGITDDHIQKVCNHYGLKDDQESVCKETVLKAWEVFTKNDCELVEINPLFLTVEGKMIAGDAKVILDDTALYRHDFDFPKRAGFREMTNAEQRAREIDARTHRGVVGRTYLDLDGDIGFICSGGGASMTCIDALLTYGGEPANFTEFSGNPEKEDVYELAKVVLSKPGLRALWVVGATANFTDTYETIAGILDAVKEVRPTYPIVIRRAGPRDDEAKELVASFKEETGLNIEFIGEEMSMTESANALIKKLKIED